MKSKIPYKIAIALLASFLFFIIDVTSVLAVADRVELYVKKPDGTEELVKTCVGSGNIVCTLTYDQCVQFGVYQGKAKSYEGTTLLSESDWANMNVCEGCNNGVCESGETQDNCPQDCKTTVSITPILASPGTIATLTVEFWDSRYQPTHTVTIAITIGGIPWTSCFHNKDITDQVSCSGYNCQLTKEAGHFKIVGQCVVPYIPGVQTLRVEPSFGSLLVTLHHATTEFKIASTGTAALQENVLIKKITDILISIAKNFLFVV